MGYRCIRFGIGDEVGFSITSIITVALLSQEAVHYS